MKIKHLLTTVAVLGFSIVARAESPGHGAPVHTAQNPAAVHASGKTAAVGKPDPQTGKNKVAAVDGDATQLNHDWPDYMFRFGGWSPMILQDENQ